MSGACGCGCGGACCGCCEGVERLTPVAIANRPGLSALVYRVGTHARFLASMEAALSDPKLLGDAPNPLLGLHTRETSDLAIALLDAWACVGDVLTFYQERIANEGYLRTATELFSVLQLARLIGYELRPGVSASTFLALELEDGYRVDVPAGTRAQSVPAAPGGGAGGGSGGPATGAAAGAAAIAAAAAGIGSTGGGGALPQMFETSETLPARSEWNALVPRQTKPLAIDLKDPASYATLYLKGTPNVTAGARLLLIDTLTNERAVGRVISAEADHVNQRTEVKLASPAATVAPEPLTVLTEELNRAVTHPVAPHSRLSAEVVQVLKRLLLQLQGPVAPEHAVATSPAQRLTAAAQQLTRLIPRDPRYVELRAWIERLRSDIELTAEHIAPPLPARQQPPREAPVGAERELLASGGAAFRALDRLVAPLLEAPSTPPRSRFALSRSADSLKPPSDSSIRIAAAFHPQLRAEALYDALGKLAQRPATIEVYLLKLTASAYGQAAPPVPPTLELAAGATAGSGNDPLVAGDEDPSVFYLDADYPQVTAGGWAVIERSDQAQPTQRSYQILDAQSRSRAQYGLTGKTSKLTLDGEWWLASSGDFQVLRGATIFTNSEQLELAEAPISQPVSGARIELDGAYDGLTAGRWLVVAGQRILRTPPAARSAVAAALDVRPHVSKWPTVAASELVMLADAKQHLGHHPGETTRTWIELASPLAYTYERDTVKIYANVVHATHGETTTEVLGSGDGSQANQRFTLRQTPLTYTAAATPSGVASSLTVRVDEVEWHEAPGLAALGLGDRRHLTQADAQNRNTVIFGDGRRGARLPTGVENVVATYRKGIGSAGNLETGQISQLASKPLGVRAVNNPVPATGGADRDDRDGARRNAPLSVDALDRLVSVQDYEDFARVFAGIGKASAVALSDGRRRLVHVTVAGAADIPIAENSDLYLDLLAALRQFGDPELPVLLALRELLLIVIAARVRVAADYSWPLVEPHVRAALLDRFGFERRELGQDATAGAVLACIQAVPGVDWVELDTFDSIAQPQPQPPPPAAHRPGRVLPSVRVRAQLAHVVRTSHPVGRTIAPAQLALLSDDTLVLSEDTR